MIMYCSNRKVSGKYRNGLHCQGVFPQWAREMEERRHRSRTGGRTQFLKNIFGLCYISCNLICKLLGGVKRFLIPDALDEVHPYVLSEQIF